MRQFPVMSDIEGYFTEEQAKAVIDSVGNIRDRMLLQLLWATGARVSEILKLTKRNLNLKDRIITMPNLKRRYESYRPVRIPAETVELLEEYLTVMNIKGGERLFPITRQRAYQIVRECAEMAGIKEVGMKEKHPHPHNFRHSYAINWIKKGGDLVKLQRLLGHTNLNTTQQYLQFGGKDFDEDFKKVWGEE